VFEEFEDFRISGFQDFWISGFGGHRGEAATDQLPAPNPKILKS
jgi:hypothetical protein